jgi:hypothetical protein
VGEYGLRKGGFKFRQHDAVMFKLTRDGQFIYLCIYSTLFS